MCVQSPLSASRPRAGPTRRNCSEPDSDQRSKVPFTFFFVSATSRNDRKFATCRGVTLVSEVNGQELPHERLIDSENQNWIDAGCVYHNSLNHRPTRLKRIKFSVGFGRTIRWPRTKIAHQFTFLYTCTQIFYGVRAADPSGQIAILLACAVNVGILQPFSISESIVSRYFMEEIRYDDCICV